MVGHRFEIFPIFQDTSAVTVSKDSFILDYDYLIVAVGAETNTFGTPGVKENAYFLKVQISCSISRQGVLGRSLSPYQNCSQSTLQILPTIVLVMS